MRCAGCRYWDYYYNRGKRKGCYAMVALSSSSSSPSSSDVGSCGQWSGFGVALGGSVGKGLRPQTTNLSLMLADN